MKALKFLSLIFFLSLACSINAQIKISFLVDDSFGKSINSSVNLLKQTYPEIAKKCIFKEFIYSNYEEDDTNFFEQSDLIFITLHNKGYIFKAKSELIEALRDRACVYALNMSHEYDTELESWGVRFDPKTLDYFKNGGDNNIINIIFDKLSKDFAFDIPIQDIELSPLSGIYNIHNKKLYPNYASFIKDRSDLQSDKPWFAFIVGRSDLTKSQYLYIDDFIKNISNEGFNVLPIFTSQQAGHQEDEVLNKFLIPSDSMPKISVMLNLGCWYNIRPDQERMILEQLRIPVINGIVLSTNQSDWENSLVGIDVYNRSNLIAIPELAGYIFPSVSVVFDDSQDNIKMRKVIDYQLKTVLGRIKNLYNLQTKANKDKKVALIFTSIN